MASCLDIATRALRLLGVGAAGDTPTADEASDAITALSRMLAGWEGEGIRLGALVNGTLTTTTTITVPVTHLNAIEWNLAAEMLPEYGRRDPAMVQLVMQRAAELKRALLAQYVNVPTLRADEALMHASRAPLGAYAWDAT